MVEPGGIIVDAKTGISGAGRGGGSTFGYAEVNEDVSAYNLFKHAHTPEMREAIARMSGGQSASVVFTPHLIPMTRGLLATCYARPRPGASAARVEECLRAAYAHAPFVRAVAPDEVRLSRVVGTNLAYVGATADADMVVAVGAIDNLLKGAAGQAVQNVNAMNGWDETLGLDHLQRVSP